MKQLILALSLFVITFSACKKDKETIEDTTGTVETCQTGSYCFLRNGQSTVDYSGQTARLNQLSELVTYVKSGSNPNTVLDVNVLNDMFSNADGAGSAYFSSDAAVSGKQLEDKCFLGTLDNYYTYFNAVASASTSTTEGSNGVAGIVTSIYDSNRTYLLDANGFDYKEIIEKGLIGDVFYFQATATYLNGTESGTYDNTSILDSDNGKQYTEAEHKFDEAFGYFGIPVDFPQNTSDLRFYGKYCHSRDAALGTNAIMDAFIGCRNAIVANEDVLPFTTDIRLQWHRVIAGTAISYLKQAKENLEDPAMKCHQLSEAHGFIGNLIHNSSAYALTPAQVQEARDLLGWNFYEVTASDIDATIEYLLENTQIEFLELVSL